MTHDRVSEHDFALYPPKARALAISNLHLFNRLPIVFSAILLREVIGYDWNFPAERRELDDRLGLLKTLSDTELSARLKGFVQIHLGPALENFNAAVDPIGFMEQLTALLWSTAQMANFRATAQAFAAYAATRRSIDSPSHARLGIVVIGQGARSSDTALFRKLRPHGVYFDNIQPQNGLNILLDAVHKRSARQLKDAGTKAAAAFDHWYIDGGDAQESSIDVLLSYSQLQQPRVRLLERMQKIIASGSGGPEGLRSFLAKMQPADIGLGDGMDPILSYFAMSLLTQGSGTQIFATTLVQWAARECLRNDAFDTHQYYDLPGTKLLEYRQNLFGGTLGGPIWKNHLFFFGDMQGNRVINGANTTLNVPTALERLGNFSELLDPLQTGDKPVYVFQQLSGGGPTPGLVAPGSTVATAAPYQQIYNGQVNVMDPSTINPLAQKLLDLYPLPNTVNTRGNGLLNNNYTTPIIHKDNTVQWDARLDYNISSSDQAFIRNSYSHRYQFFPSPLGQVLDGGGFGSDGNEVFIGDNIAFSETHIFSPRLLNEFRLGDNYGHFYFIEPNATNLGFASSYGLNGIPQTPLNGGLPNVWFHGGIAPSGFGASNYYPSNEHEYIWQILDNVTFDLGNHSLKAGVDIQRIRFMTLQPPASHGNYNYSGAYSSAYNVPHTGFALADFLSDNQSDGSLTSVSTVDDFRWDRSVFLQDDWKISRRLTANLGLRAENQTPYAERYDNQANFYPTQGITYDPTIGQQGQSSSAGVYVLPQKSSGTPLPANFLAVLAKDNIAVKYSNNRYLIDYPFFSWSPRVGLSYKLDDRTVLRAGFGIFFGGLESVGFAPNLGLNYPFTSRPSLTSPGNLPCTFANCQTDGIKLATGYSAFLAGGGLANFVGTPSLNGISNNQKTPRTDQFNLTLEHAFGSDLTATVAYVGSLSRNTGNFPNFNSAPVITPACNSGATNTPCGTGNSQRPFPDVNISLQNNNGIANYNSLQTELQKRLSHGLSFLATYTWSHSMSSAGTSIAQGDNFTSAGSPSNYNIFGTGQGYARSPEDVRNRFTFLTNYTLPFGRGQRFLNGNGIASQALGGWEVSLTEQIQSGEPFTVGIPSYIQNVNNLNRNAILFRDPFVGGGTPDPSLNFPVGVGCPAKVHNSSVWFNPCAFRNPLPASQITTALLTPAQVAPYLGDRNNQISGPGYNRTNISLFKSFAIFHESQLQVRADIFNVLNSPAFSIGGGNDGPNGGVINTNSYRFFQDNTPNSRFFQFSARLSF